jgi:hypothetical protein
MDSISAAATCHQAEEHRIAGSRIQMTAADPHGAILRGARTERNPATCQACHGDRPHEGASRPAGSTTIPVPWPARPAIFPTFARGGVPTKMGWDWSTAGQLDKDGKPFQRKDDKGT